MSAFIYLNDKEWLDNNNPKNYGCLVNFKQHIKKIIKKYPLTENKPNASKTQNLLNYIDNLTEQRKQNTYCDVYDILNTVNNWDKFSSNELEVLAEFISFDSIYGSLEYLEYEEKNKPNEIKEYLKEKEKNSLLWIGCLYQDPLSYYSQHLYVGKEKNFHSIQTDVAGNIEDIIIDKSLFTSLVKKICKKDFDEKLNLIINPSNYCLNSNLTTQPLVTAI